jgi:hypothetical protein
MQAAVKQTGSGAAQAAVQQTGSGAAQDAAEQIHWQERLLIYNRHVQGQHRLPCNRCVQGLQTDTSETTQVAFEHEQKGRGSTDCCGQTSPWAGEAAAEAVLRIRIRDPGSLAFFDPWIRDPE